MKNKPHCPYCGASAHQAIAHPIFTIELWHCADPDCTASFEVLPGTNRIRIGFSRWMCCRDRHRSDFELNLG